MGRIAIRAGDPATEPADYRVEAGPAPLATEEDVRAAFRAALAAANAQGARSVAAPALGAGSLPLQRCAELLLEEARRHFATASSVEEICFVVTSEPAYRLFEAVQDAARIAEQMERLRGRGERDPSER